MSPRRIPRSRAPRTHPTGLLPAPALAPLTALAALAAFAALAAGCGDAPADADAGARWEAVVDTVADTVVVRTVSGSVWGDTLTLVPEVEIGVLDGPDELIFGQVGGLAVGPGGEILVMDRQVPEVRVFGPGGAYLRTVGRPGEGPGELDGPDGGFTTLSDGRLLVRDPANNRIQTFLPDGTPDGTWPYRGSFSTSNPLWRDRDDNVYSQLLTNPGSSVEEWELGLATIHPDGTFGDTLPVPDADYESRSIEARREGSWSRSNVPFSATEQWAFHPDGYFVHGVADAYAFTLLREGDQGPPLRIERSHEPVPVAPGEAAEAKAAATAQMRTVVPDWRWNGPEVPDTKPPFRSILVGRDGRIWVSVSTPGYRVEDPDHDPGDPDDPDAVPDEWREDVAFDVFEPDGRYLGHVRAPRGFSLFPTPVFEGDRAWAVLRDDLGVQRVVRLRLDAPEHAG